MVPAAGPEDNGRAAMECGLVDVTVVSVDEKWPALNFVYRLKDRAGERADAPVEPG